MNYDKEYREWLDWPDFIQSTAEIANGAEAVHLYREKKSHRGIANFTSINRLLAKQVDQDFLNEIGLLSNLEYLEMEVVTAENLKPLSNLKKLRTLKLDGARKATDFSPLLKIESLTKLFLENAKFIDSLDFLENAHNLVAIGIEGGMYTKQKIKTLQPLSGLMGLEALFMSSVQLNDKNLDCLSSIPNLHYLGSARFAPKASFDSLRRLMPNLVCRWCDSYEV
jgi:hypothetical protein